MGFFPSRRGVLFVCTANICRSPIVESVFRAAAERAGLLKTLRVDSAGTHGGHVGQRIDPRAVAAMRDYGVTPARHRARQIRPADFRRFERIFAVDATNLRLLAEMRPPDGTATVELLLDLAPRTGHAEIPDPYFGSSQSFDLAVRLALAAADALVIQLSAHGAGRPTG